MSSAAPCPRSKAFEEDVYWNNLGNRALGELSRYLVGRKIQSPRQRACRFFKPSSLFLKKDARRDNISYGHSRSVILNRADTDQEKTRRRRRRQHSLRRKRDRKGFTNINQNEGEKEG